MLFPIPGSLIISILIITAAGAPAPSLATVPSPASSLSVVPEFDTVAVAPTAANSQAPTATPLPMMDGLGGNILGPQNVEMEQQNIDLFAPPNTDNGIMLVLFLTTGPASINIKLSSSTKWPFALSHNRLQTGGWARQQNGKFSGFGRL